MHRFFVNEKLNNYFILDQKILNHIKVLRIKNEFFLCNYENVFYKCILEKNKAKIIKKLSINNEYKNELILAIGLISLKNFELILQKATELGVTKIIPFYSTFSNYKKTFILKKLTRWKEIILNAAEQSFRNKIPILEIPCSFEKIISLNVKNKFLAYENQKSDEIIKSFDTNSIFVIGPEGGFSEEEIKKAKNNNFQIISLGKRILKTESAVFFVLSRVNEK